MLLEPELLARLERLSLTMRERLAGIYPGEHRSTRLGSSVDFADWRPYVAGDDFRRIDYQIYARLDRLLVRLYEAEDEASVQIVLDCSRSMDFEGKFIAAARFAGALAYLAALRGDRARLWALDGNGIHPSPWARSRDSAVGLLNWAERLDPAGAMDLVAALAQLSAARSMGGVTLLVSDLLIEDWEIALRRLARPGVVAGLIHVLAPSELDPDLRGDLMLVDSEAEQSLDVSVSEQVLRSYKRRAAEWAAAVAETCRRRGCVYARLRPEDDLEAFLLVRMRSEGLVK